VLGSWRVNRRHRTATVRERTSLRTDYGRSPTAHLRGVPIACHARNVRPPTRRILFALLLAGIALHWPSRINAQAGTQKKLQIDSFEFVWTTIRDKHWETRPGGLDWDAIHEEYRPQMEAATTSDQARSVIRAMLARLHETHFAIFPAGVAEDIANDEGDGTPGFDVRVLDGHVIVTDVFGDEAVHTGWELIRSGAWDIQTLLAKLQADPAINEYALVRAIQSRLTGVTGTEKHYVFEDGGRARLERNLRLKTPRGELATFGNLTSQHVWFESRKNGNTGIIRLTEFLDLPRIIPAFGKAIQECAQCDGLIIDIRGNPGGIGGMAMGMAGWLIDRANQRLGTMYMRGATLNFIVNPRANAYTGPVAILVDGTSASTSEIFAGGLQDLHRARIFGTRTAGAALPSVITRLPNGDGFQYAVANYISAGGRALEGNGVTPDVQVKLTREGLLEGHDSILDAALQWIHQQRRQP